jgi:hypothetical protein
MKTNNVIRLEVRKDYRFKHISLEEIGGRLVFMKNNPPFWDIYYKKYLLDKNWALKFTSEQQNILDKGAILTAEVESVEEVDEENAVINLSILIDVDNVDKLLKLNAAINNAIDEVNSSAGIYKINIDEITYIGQTTNFKKRFRSHADKLALGMHSNHGLRNAWLNDFDVISFKILQYADNRLSGIELQDWLAIQEQDYIVFYRKLGDNVNILNGEVIATKAAIKQYKDTRETAIKHIKNTRKLRKIENNLLIEQEVENRTKVSELIDITRAALNSINSSKSSFTRIGSSIGLLSKSTEELILLKKLAEYDVMYQEHNKKLYELRSKARELRKLKLTEQEKNEMKSMGYEYRREFG